MTALPWRSFRDAPAAGTRLAASSDLAEGATLSGAIGAFPWLLARGPAGLRAFVNACPHQFLPLDHRGSRVLSADGAVLRCTNHGAGFCAVDGEGVEGLGLGCAISPIPVEERDGEIRVS